MTLKTGTQDEITKRVPIKQRSRPRAEDQVGQRGEVGERRGASKRNWEEVISGEGEPL